MISVGEFFWKGRNKLLHDVGDMELDLEGHKWTLGSIIGDIKRDNYRVYKIDFKANDIVLDIGGHCGEFAIHLAKKFPFIEVISFEPIFPLYLNFLRNMDANGVDNITLNNCAVTGDGRNVNLVSSLNLNTGGSSIYMKDINADNQIYNVPSMTLDAIFEQFEIEKCKLLKIDTEGSEYEILYNTKYLDRVEYFRAELHENSYIRSLNYGMYKLADYVSKHVKDMFFETCYMHE